MFKRFLQVFVLLLTLFGSLRLYYNKQVGDVLDQHNGVDVYFNNLPFTSKGKSFGTDGYIYGTKYSSLEFVRRYYDKHYNHKMNQNFEYAKDIYDRSLKDGEKNIGADLTQYSNPSKFEIEEGDIIVFDKSFVNFYGRVAVVTRIDEDKIEVIEQNLWKKTREILDIEKNGDLWNIKNKKVLGRLQKSR